MNKTDLINEIAERADISKATAGKVLDAVTVSITEALKRGDRVQLTGFGTFSISERAERIGHRPGDATPITIAASKSPKFKPGKSLKTAVNN